MTPPATERRTRTRIPRFLRQQVDLRYLSDRGAEVLQAKLTDITSDGWGVELGIAVSPGTIVLLSGESLHSTVGDTTPVRSRVIWCRKRGVGYRVGLVRAPEAQRENPEPPPRVEPVEVDHYEVLQLSPNADQETVQRVYRLLAQRYHPDHAETGDSEMFQRVVAAFQVLSDPERRAAYDVDYQMTRRLRWKIFDQPSAAQGLEAEKRKRKGILGLLYAKRIHQPDRAGMSLIELEELLGVPREHLEFSMWYLKESGLVTRGDNGRYAITVKGVDDAEKEGQVSIPRERLLPEGSHSPASSQN